MKKWISKPCTGCRERVFYLPEWNVYPEKCQLCCLKKINWTNIFKEIDSDPSLYEKKHRGIKKKLKAIYLEAKRKLTSNISDFVSTFANLVKKDKDLAKFCIQLNKDIKFYIRTENKIKRENQKREHLINDGKRRIG